VNITHGIAHQVMKEQHVTDTTLRLRDVELELNDQVYELVDKVRKLYNQRSSKAYGGFSEHSRFRQEVRRFLEDDCTFLDFTRSAMEELKGRISSAPAATGGYMFFARYEQEDEEFFLVVMLKRTGGISFNENLEVLQVHHLDLDTLHLAARVNVSQWEQFAERNRYISFVKGRANADVRDYFKLFLGVEEFSESAENTLVLINVVRDYCVQRHFDLQAANAARERVHEYGVAKIRDNSPIQLEDVSRLVNPEAPDDFMAFANAPERSVVGEFHLNRAVFRRLRRYYGKDKYVSISFEGALYGERVLYDAETDTLRIHPPPESLKRQLGIGEDEG
jgi:nucleoid-associated protein